MIDLKSSENHLLEENRFSPNDRRQELMKS